MDFGIGIEQAFDWKAFEALLAPIHASAPRRAGVSASGDVQDPASAAVAHALRPRRGGCGSGPVVVSPLLRFAVGGGDAGPRSDLALPPDDRQARPFWRRCFPKRTGSLDGLGLIVKRGTLVDATLIAASVERPAYGDKGVNPRDPDARVTMKRKTVHFGYKAHLAVDEEKRSCPPCGDDFGHNVHDFCLAEALIQGDEQGYFADKAYSCHAFRETLERRGLG